MPSIVIKKDIDVSYYNKGYGEFKTEAAFN